MVVCVGVWVGWWCRRCVGGLIGCGLVVAGFGLVNSFNCGLTMKWF